MVMSPLVGSALTLFCEDIVGDDEFTGDAVDDNCGDVGGVGGALKTNGRPCLFLDGTLTGMTSPCRSGSSNLMR